MKKFMKTKAGVVLFSFSVFAVWALLAAQSVQAQVAPSAPPGCPSSSIISNIADADTATVDDSIPNLSGELVNDDDTNTPENERVRTLYFKLTVPALTAGELTVTAQSGAPRTVGRLCRGGSSLIVHPRTASDATNDEPNFEANMVPVTPGDYYVVVSGQNVDNAGVRQTTPEEGTVTLTVSFNGVRPTTAGTSDVGNLRVRGQRDEYDLTTSIGGLLTVQTTGSTDTKGEFTGDNTDMGVTADAGGSSSNFQIIAPVTAGDKMVFVEGQVPTETGEYTLDVDFEVATSLTLDNNLAVTYGDATDDSEPTEIKSGEADYFFFSVTANQGLMTIETKRHASITSGAGTPTRGTLYGPKGLIETDDNSGDGGNFWLRAPVAAGNYIVKVEGQGSGPYILDISTATATVVAPGGASTEVTVTAPAGSAAAHVAHYHITVATAGTLQVRTTGNVDTVGELYGPDGGLIAEDEDSGEDANFQITEYVEAGGYIVVVRAADRMTNGMYTLQTGFIEGVEVDPPDTGGGGGGGGGGTTPPPDPDPTGSLDEPPPGGVRSGIGIIRGWVCQDAGNGVEIRIMNSDGTRAATFTAPYGSDRGDVDIDEHCDRRTDGVGFAVQYNYNLLAEGTYTIEAYVGRDQVGLSSGGQTNTFRVVRIGGEFEIRLSSGRIPVQNFPRQGDTTILEWDQSSQNFQIVDHQ